MITASPPINGSTKQAAESVPDSETESVRVDGPSDFEIDAAPLDDTPHSEFESEVEVTTSKPNPSYVVSASAKNLLPITAEELEHVKDKALDAEYERKLIETGDHLRPFRSLGDMLPALFGADEPNEEPGTPFSAEVAARSNKAVEIAWKMGKDDTETTELPTLSENPDEAELIAFASEYPTIKHILKLFKGKVVRAKKK